MAVQRHIVGGGLLNPVDLVPGLAEVVFRGQVPGAPGLGVPVPASI